MTVRAFQPRRIDPPQFVAENLVDLEEMLGDFIGAGQCDGCGNWSFQIRRTIRGFFGVCAADPSDRDDDRHPDPCGAAYVIGVYDEDEVVF